MSIGAIVDRALATYGSDWRLYLALALAAFCVQGIVALVAGRSDQSDLYVQVANLGVDAFLAGCVSIGVAARMRDEPRPHATILAQAARRWWAIALVDLVVWLVRAFSFDAVFGGLEDTGYGLFAIPTLAIWGTLLFADVIASIDEETPPAALPGFALVRSVVIACARNNLWRVTLLSAMTLPAIMLPMVLDDALRIHGVAGHAFWSSIPVDALLIGPYQALFTVFYFDLRNRVERRR